MELARLMSPDPVTIDLGATLDRALQLMDDHDVRHLPVVDPAGSLVGVISDRDVLPHVGWVPALGVSHKAARADEPGPHEVSEVMHSPVTTASPDDTVVTGAVDLVVSRIGCLPVVEKGALVGLVSEMDLAAAYWRECQDERLRPDVDEPVTDHMTAHPITVSFDTPVAEAAALCRARHVRHLPVMEGSRLRGILSDRDLRAASAHGGPGDSTAGTIMAPYPVTLAPTDRMSDAAERMVGHRISCLPVVEGDELIGIITLTDLLDHCLNTLRSPEST